MIEHTVGDGKYTVIFHDSGKMEALRYGEPWQDLTGDGLILAMLQEIDDFKKYKSLVDQQVLDLKDTIERTGVGEDW